MHDIKTVRNKLCHNQDLEAREVYESLDNIQRFFELFKENMPNKFSQRKHEFVEMINKRRVLALENLMKEEQYKQIARCIRNAGRQICELKGYHEIYTQALGLDF